MKIGIEIDTRFDESARVYRSRLRVAVGGRLMFIAGQGDTAEDAELAVSESFQRALDQLEQLRAIWERAGRINWWAAEHSKEVGP